MAVYYRKETPQISSPTICYYTNVVPQDYRPWYEGDATCNSPEGTPSSGCVISIILNDDKFVLPENASYMFYKSVSASEYYLTMPKGDTSQCTNMSHMFQYGFLWGWLDLSSGDVSNVTDMSYMFDNQGAQEYGHLEMERLYMGYGDTSKVTDMTQMFSHCHSLEVIDMSGGDTSNVTSMSAMFFNLDSIQELDLSSFDTSKVTTIANMFSSCGNLRTIYAEETFVLTGLIDGSEGVFSANSALIGGKGTSWQFNGDNDPPHQDMWYNRGWLAKIDGGISDMGYFTYKRNYKWKPYKIYLKGLAR